MTSVEDEVDRREVDSLGRVLWYKPLDVVQLAMINAELVEEAQAAQAAEGGKSNDNNGTGEVAAAETAAAPAVIGSSKASRAPKSSSPTVTEATPVPTPGPLTFADVLSERGMLRAVKAELGSLTVT